MNNDEPIEVIKELSQSFVDKKIDGRLYTDVVESLIRLNLELVPELENFADYLTQYHPDKDMPELYSNNDLKDEY